MGMFSPDENGYIEESDLIKINDVEFIGSYPDLTIYKDVVDYDLKIKVVKDSEVDQKLQKYFKNQNKYTIKIYVSEV